MASVIASRSMLRACSLVIPAFSPEQGQGQDQRNAGGRGNQLIGLLLDRAGDSKGQHFVEVVPPWIEVEFLVLPGFGDQGFHVVHVCLHWGGVGIGPWLGVTHL